MFMVPVTVVCPWEQGQHQLLTGSGTALMNPVLKELAHRGEGGRDWA
jgi:hypothetical protein